MPLSRFTNTVLYHPEHGYYRTRPAIGAAGDFVTAPEISQIFGELIGLWAVQTWLDLGRPDPFELIELGPGRGTLIADAVRAGAAASGFLGAARLHLVDSNQTLKAQQEERLSAARPRLRDVVWHDAVDTLPDGPSAIIANEFFDCLPIRQFQRTHNGWHERLVGYDYDTDELILQLAPYPAPSSFIDSMAPPAHGAGPILEYSAAGEALASALAQRLVACGGRMLIVDYGDTAFRTATFQAIKRHRPHDPFRDLGTADLTAHVNFAHLAEAALGAGACVWGPVLQGVFLNRLGLLARAAALGRSAGPAQARELETAVDRLTAPDQMGSLFKALAVGSPGLPVPPGFDRPFQSIGAA